MTRNFHRILPPGFRIASKSKPHHSIYHLGMSTAGDYEIFESARKAGAIVITKDRDFVDLLTRHGPPPQVIWLRCGNTTNQRLKSLFELLLPDALELLQSGQNFVEIRD